ncbi:hypothetical protein PHET_02361 [Paragonimus heterotremus]|uniref:Uncharacterized protein n=1 Tax=Paragonimus heterotremus TaxID=100268 RepID=A0A8J4TFR0_9TREM|nr:hypothetical protein PHET_02361 [Paragonimus heterotremus]
MHCVRNNLYEIAEVSYTKPKCCIVNAFKSLIPAHCCSKDIKDVYPLLRMDLYATLADVEKLMKVNLNDAYILGSTQRNSPCTHYNQGSHGSNPVRTVVFWY